MRYTDAEDPDVEHRERCGVIHLVHGWTQLGHRGDGLYLSSEHTKSGTGAAAIKAHYLQTALLAETLGIWFRKLFPAEYAKFVQAFEAGVWVSEDPGPWLGRALVFKLQVEPHLDGGDDGPAVSFPVGHYDGGEMVVPCLNTKFSYRPGQLCFFPASKIFHAIARWTPKQAQPGDTVTPGRIGTVFFTPSACLETLQDKEPGWSIKTAMGRAPDLGY
ncbi:hypothetical protein FPV67DRAFT_1416497 [Lyophyllum atratum]|nr:hypothetical protein FPV67DRAFT_1433078 [Lyophyllum atratum]KAF8068100.1 hypothetical protein FPV67DRAFT_1416497 [Lyophyllum atratum]